MLVAADASNHDVAAVTLYILPHRGEKVIPMLLALTPAENCVQIEKEAQ